LESVLCHIIIIIIIVVIVVMSLEIRGGAAPPLSP